RFPPNETNRPWQSLGAELDRLSETIELTTLTVPALAASPPPRAWPPEKPATLRTTVTEFSITSPPAADDWIPPPLALARSRVKVELKTSSLDPDWLRPPPEPPAA